MLLIAAMSKGTNCQHLFPNIAILIANKNPEIKKMIYICLGHYAELEQTTALLAINILEKDLANSNQLIRAHALRTISNVRVKMITQLVVAAVVGGTKDSSSYVRKTAAHAILKVWSLDPSQKDILVEAIEKLLQDRENSVLGSAAAAFNEVCPDNYEIVHKAFRRLCDALLDIDEWGQQHVLTLLTKYARTQFVDPEKEKVAPEKKEGDVESEDDDFMAGFDAKIGDLEPDHRLLLDCCLPLLKSRSAGVVMCVATLYKYCAPKNELGKVVRSLIRFLRESREIQFVLLNYIHSMALSDPTLFQPFLVDFFVSGNEPTFSRNVKLDILTLLANDANIDRILKEFKFYAMQGDKEFVAKTIRSIGLCAMRLPEVLERCISHLMHFLASKNETVVAESVVVLKQLLQMPREEGVSYDEVIKQLTRLFTKVTSPKARASIIWVVGEYVDVISQYAPDILRQLAKGFATEPDVVKMQIINLAVKLLLTNPEQTHALAHYVFFMAKFDTNYDIRDKARAIRFLLPPQQSENPGILQKNARKLLLTTKPSPSTNDEAENNKNKFALGSLSFMVRHTVPGYVAIPDWAAEPADASKRKPLVSASFNSMSGGNKFVGFGSNSLPQQEYSPKQPEAGKKSMKSFDQDLESFLGDDGGDYDEGEEGEYEEGEYEEGEYEEGEYEEGEYEEGEYEEGEEYYEEGEEQQ